MRIRLRKPINTAVGINLPVGAELDVPERVARHLVVGRFAEEVAMEKKPARKEAEKPSVGDEAGESPENA